ncbi:MAG: inorganic phosphate transporter, partial [Methylococcaceae bacterium]|nr:inorganic phosphate transporter [Methylococcaceae bacterium]
KKASIAKKSVMLAELKEQAKNSETNFTKRERKTLKKVYQKELVKRSHVYKIAAAWIITVPFSALLAAMLYFTIRGIMIP